MHKISKKCDKTDRFRDKKQTVQAAEQKNQICLTTKRTGKTQILANIRAQLLLLSRWAEFLQNNSDVKLKTDNRCFVAIGARPVLEHGPAHTNSLQHRQTDKQTLTLVARGRYTRNAQKNDDEQSLPTLNRQ